MVGTNRSIVCGWFIPIDLYVEPIDFHAWCRRLVWHLCHNNVNWVRGGRFRPPTVDIFCNYRKLIFKTASKTSYRERLLTWIVSIGNCKHLLISPGVNQIALIPSNLVINNRRTSCINWVYKGWPNYAYWLNRASKGNSGYLHLNRDYFGCCGTCWNIWWLVTRSFAIVGSNSNFNDNT